MGSQSSKVSETNKLSRGLKVSISESVIRPSTCRSCNSDHPGNRKKYLENFTLNPVSKEIVIDTPSKLFHYFREVRQQNSVELTIVNGSNGKHYDIQTENYFYQENNSVLGSKLPSRRSSVTDQIRPINQSTNGSAMYSKQTNRNSTKLDSSLMSPISKYSYPHSSNLVSDGSDEPDETNTKNTNETFVEVFNVQKLDSLDSPNLSIDTKALREKLQNIKKQESIKSKLSLKHKNLFGVSMSPVSTASIMSPKSNKSYNIFSKKKIAPSVEIKDVQLNKSFIVVEKFETNVNET